VLVCNWLHSIEQNHFVVLMLFNRVSTIQKCFQKILHSFQVRKLVPCQPSGRRVIPSGRPVVQSSSRLDDVSYCPNAHQTKASSVWKTWIFVRTFLYVEKLRTAPACIRPNVSAARPNNSQCSIKLQDFFTNAEMGRLLQPSRQRGFPSGCAHL